ncbi:translocation/assembly module TamB domain-containing protein [Alkalinema pantanalense CENA528]|uniref:translocation/assembly module TamB domain-containing protein n=1 Tax=Alkalinema pantanalense TaxID=1620705 RepID=UPI003D6E0D25
MTHDDPGQDHVPQPRRRHWRRFVVPLGLVTVAGVGLWAVDRFIKQDLTPLVQRELSRQLKRPIQVGKLERYSLTGLRIGPSALPATPTDADTATVEAIEVGFDLWKTLWTRKLKLNLTLISPTAFLDETKPGVWVTTEIEESKEEPPVKVELSKIKLQNAQVELSPSPEKGKKRRSIYLNDLNGKVEIFDNNRQFSYEVAGESRSEGKFQLEGQSRSIKEVGVETNLQVRGQNYLLSEVDNLIRLPIDLPVGRGDGNLRIELRPGKKLPSLNGTATFKDVTLKVPDLPYPISKATGELQLQGTEIKLGSTKALFGGQIPVTAAGTLDLEKGFNLNAKVAAVTIPTFFKTFAIKFPLPVTGEMAADVKLTGPIEAPILTGTTRNTKLVVADRVPTKQVKADFRLDAKTAQLQLTDVLAVPQAGGQVTGGGTIDLKAPGRLNLAFRAENVPGDPIGRIYSGGSDLPIAVNNVDANITVTGALTNPLTVMQWQAPNATYAARGDVIIQGAITRLQNTIAQVEGGIANIDGTIADGKLALNILTEGIALNRFSSDLRGIFSGRLQLTGALANLRPEALRLTGDTRFSEGISIIKQPIVAQIDWDGQKVNVRQATAPGFRASGAVFANLTGKPELTGLDLNVQAQGVQITDLPLALPPIAQITGSSDFNGRLTGSPTAPTVIGNVGVNGLVVNGIAFAPMVGGINLQTGRGMQLNLAGSGDRVALLLDGQFQPLTASVKRGTMEIEGRKSGSLFQVAIQQVPLAELRNLGLESSLAALKPQLGNLQLGGLLSGNVALNLQRQTLDAGTIAIAQPRLGNFQGQQLTANLQGVDLTRQTVGSGTVTIAQPKLGNLFAAADVQANFGAVNLAQGRINGGTIQASQLQAGTFRAEQFTAKLGTGNPIDGQRGEIIAINPKVGALVGEKLSAPFFIANNRLVLEKSVLSLPLLDGNKQRIGTSQYAVKGTADWRSDPKFEGEIEIADGRLQDVLGTAQIFQLSDLGRGLQPPNYSKATDLQPTSVGLPDDSVQNQLKRFAEINQWLTQLGIERENLVLPELADVRGLFGGTIKVSASLKSGVKAEFDLKAKNVEWHPYPTYLAVNRKGQLETIENRKLVAEEVILQGEFDNGVIGLRPFQIRSGDTRITLSSVQFGGEEQTGQLRIENLPVEEIQNFIPTPLAIGGQPLGINGKLNAVVSLSGTKDNPNLIGSLNLAEGLLNGNPIQAARGNFSYIDGRLNFSNTILTNSEEPLLISGNVPIPLNLPFAQVTPSSSEIDLKVRVKDDGLALLNLLGQPVSWAGGKGQVNLTVSGTLFQPKAVGEIVLNGAKIQAQALPEPLTEVNGRIKFDLDHIDVENLTGQFSRGQVVAKGTLPIFNPLPDPDLNQEVRAANGQPPLTIDLSRIAISLKGLYQGGVNGRVVLGGSALAPKIGGEIRLADGQVLLSDEAVATAGTTDGATDPTAQPQQSFEFSNLKLALGNNIRIVKAPILNFVATGNLLLNGPLNDLQPNGRIDLQAGQVNLFTTQFVLARGYKNRAEFSPEKGLDPTLDVRLIASVPEVTRNRIPTNNITSEINDAPTIATNLGGLQTIRIQARVLGPASQLSENLQLTSSPSRTPTEIVALLGGGFINTLGRGDSPLGIANLAGSALLTNIQGAIGNALGFSEFRLFPTLVTGDERQKSTTLGLAAEAGIDIFRTADGTPVVSASVLRILTSGNQPTQFGLRYRINEQLLLRGSTDFSGDNRAVLEFETRF